MYMKSSEKEDKTKITIYTTTKQKDYLKNESEKLNITLNSLIKMRLFGDVRRLK